MWNIKPNVEKKIDKTLKIALKLPKSPCFFPLFGKKSFLNRTLGLGKSFLNQTTYVLKNWLYPKSFLNRDSFLNQAFLNREYNSCTEEWTICRLSDSRMSASDTNLPV